MTRKEAVVAVLIGAMVLAGFVFAETGSPGWPRTAVIILLAVIGFAATAAPVLPFLVLIPWHFIALHRGLIRRGGSPCVVSISNGAIHVTRANKLSSHALEDVATARFARNGNWTESKMLEDALGLFASDRREIVRLPGSTTGLDGLLAELSARGIPVEDVDVSAPAYLD